MKQLTAGVVLGFIIGTMHSAISPKIILGGLLILLLVCLWLCFGKYDTTIFLLILVLMILFFIGKLEFPLIPQVHFLAKYFSPVDILDPTVGTPYTGESHVFRYIVYIPTLFFSYITGLSYNTVNTIYMGSLIVCFWFLLLRNIQLLCPIGAAAITVVTLVVLGLVFLMNGRLIPAYLGAVIILNLQMKNAKERSHTNTDYTIRAVLGILLSTVSSGALAVNMIVYLFGIVMHRNRAFLVKVIPFVIFLPHLFGMLLKNLSFFGGGMDAWITMLSHGLGYFENNYISSIVLLILGICALGPVYIMVIRITQIESRLLYPMMLVFSASLIGVYGITTLTMVIPGMVILTGYAIEYLANRMLCLEVDECVK